LLASKEYQLALQQEQHLRFYLVANPAKKINDEGGRENTRGEPKKCRVPLVHEDDQRAWIGRKLEGIADLDTMIIEPRFPIRFRKAKEDRAGKIQPVCFQGVLVVKDDLRLTDLVMHGVGPGKAFGCGLLSLARA
jgi:CRISPR system Cascade subunit CasE